MKRSDLIEEVSSVIVFTTGRRTRDLGGSNESVPL